MLSVKVFSSDRRHRRHVEVPVFASFENKGFVASLQFDDVSVSHEHAVAVTFGRNLAQGFLEGAVSAVEDGGVIVTDQDLFDGDLVVRQCLFEGIMPKNVSDPSTSGLPSKGRIAIEGTGRVKISPLVRVVLGPAVRPVLSGLAYFFGRRVLLLGHGGSKGLVLAEVCWMNNNLIVNATLIVAGSLVRAYVKA